MLLVGRFVYVKLLIVFELKKEKETGKEGEREKRKGEKEREKNHHLKPERYQE